MTLAEQVKELVDAYRKGLGGPPETLLLREADLRVWMKYEGHTQEQIDAFCRSVEEVED